MEGVMQWPGITPARLNIAVAPQEGSRPFGPQGIPSDDFFPGAPSSRYFCCLRVYGCHAALHRGVICPESNREDMLGFSPD